ncbi:MAG: hypothetical protein ACMUIM_03805, partial [bacterium]
MKNRIIFYLAPLLLMGLLLVSAGVCPATSNQQHQNNHDRHHTEDKNGDGKTDLWGYYDPEGKLERVEMDSDFDGVIDTWQEYEDETVHLVVRDTNADGLKDTWDYYEKGTHTRQEKDRNQDSNIDQWVYMGDTDRVIKTLMDENQDNQPDVQIFFDQEERPKTEERDTDFDGRADVIMNYTDGELSDIQRDKDHDGKIDVWDEYENGRHLRQDTDENGDGAWDNWLFFDANEQIQTHQQDSNFNGRIDLNTKACRSALDFLVGLIEDELMNP